MDIGAIWDLIILKPMINSLITLSQVLWGNFGLTIIILTIIVRGAMYPLTLKQLRATKAIQALQPKLAALQKKHGSDKQKLAEEQMKLYKESGVSPTGCLLPMLIQMPIWIALYQSIIRVMAINPESFLNLSHYLYSWPVVYQALPLNNSFLWLNLATPDFFLAIIVGTTMWLQQKMVQNPPVPGDPKAASQAQTMTVMMPLMFTFLSMSFPSGLALYWVTSNFISFVMQYFITGWGGLEPLKDRLIKQVAQLFKGGQGLRSRFSLPTDSRIVDSTATPVEEEPVTAQEEVPAEERPAEQAAPPAHKKDKHRSKGRKGKKGKKR